MKLKKLFAAKAFVLMLAALLTFGSSSHTMPQTGVVQGRDGYDGNTGWVMDEGWHNANNYVR